MINRVTDVEIGSLRNIFEISVLKGLSSRLNITTEKFCHPMDYLLYSAVMIVVSKRFNFENMEERS